jgi:hypothetical protein
MRPDDKGKIPIEEVRQFMASEWKWLLPAKRLQRSALRPAAEIRDEKAIADSWRKPTSRPSSLNRCIPVTGSAT